MDGFDTATSESGEAVDSWLIDAGGTRLDDRRAHVRAWERWVSLLYGRACPTLQDMDPASLADPNSLLLDLRPDRENPFLLSVGTALMRECGGARPARVRAIPEQSLLSRLALHYPVVLAIGEPMAFEGEHLAPGGRSLFYRGILLPLSSAPGGPADLVHGLIHWREQADNSLSVAIAFEMGRSFAGNGGGRPGSPWGREGEAAAAAMLEPAHPELPFGL